MEQKQDAWQEIAPNVFGTDSDIAGFAPSADWVAVVVEPDAEHPIVADVVGFARVRRRDTLADGRHVEWHTVEPIVSYENGGVDRIEGSYELQPKNGQFLSFAKTRARRLIAERRAAQGLPFANPNIEVWDEL